MNLVEFIVNNYDKNEILEWADAYKKLYLFFGNEGYGQIANDILVVYLKQPVVEAKNA